MVRKCVLTAAVAAVAYSGAAFGGAITNDPKTLVSATMDGGTAKTGNTWYEKGTNTAGPLSGLPSGLVVNGVTDPLSTYQIGGPSVGNNVLLLDTANPNGTLTLASPVTVPAGGAGLSFAGSSGNGGGKFVPTLNFVGGGTDVLPSVTLGDWFNNTPIVLVSGGRIDVVTNTFNNVQSPPTATGNPRIVAGNIAVPAADAGKVVQSISLAWSPVTAPVPPAVSNVHTAIFGISAGASLTGPFAAIPLNPSSYNQDVVVGALEAPEPASVGLLAVSAVGLLIRRRRA